MAKARVHYLKGVNEATNQKGYIPCAVAAFARNHKPIRRRERLSTTEQNQVTCQRCAAILRHEDAMERDGASGG